MVGILSNFNFLSCYAQTRKAQTNLDLSSTSTVKQKDSVFSEENMKYYFVGINGVAFPFQAVSVNAGVTDGEMGVRLSLFGGKRIGFEGGLFYTLYQNTNIDHQITGLFGYNKLLLSTTDSVSTKAIWLGPAYEVTYKIIHASVGGILYMEPYQQATKASLLPIFRLGIQYWFE